MKPALGACYYPEQWPEAVWSSDARQMAEAGITYVRIGEFAWSRIEPEPGRLDIGWMLRAMDLLHAERLKVVVGTPTAAPPRWVVAKMPDMLPVDPHSRVRKFGSRRHYCFSHTGYREEAARIVRAVAEGLGGHPSLSAWQTDNEYGCHDTVLSWSPAALSGFRRWLAERYGSVTALNEAWGNAFWSMEYRSFDEIELPNLTPAEPNPSHLMDFRRYSSDQIVAFNKIQTDILKEVTPHIPVTHNYMAGMTGFDHFRVGRDLDFASWDSYPLGQLERRFGATGHKAHYARQGDPDLQAFHHDLYRAVGGGRFWVMEQQPGPVNWAPHNADPLPGMVRLWTWEAFAHGAEAVCYFRWRQAPFAQEQMHAGLLRPDNAPAPALEEARRVAGEIETGEARPVVNAAGCAIVFDYESAWAWEIQPHSRGFSHLETVLAQYRQLRKLGLDVDIISAQTGDISGYRLIFIPALFAWSGPLKDKLPSHEGVVVVGPRCGSKTPDFCIPPALPPDLGASLLDARVTRVDSLAADVPVPIEGGGNVVMWREKLETSAEVLVKSEDGWPVLIRQENLLYLAGLLDEEAHAAITKRLVALAGLTPHELPAGLRTRQAGERVFIFNYGLETHDLAVLGFSPPFGLNGARIGPGGVATAYA